MTLESLFNVLTGAGRRTMQNGLIWIRWQHYWEAAAAAWTWAACSADYSAATRQKPRKASPAALPNWASRLPSCKPGWRWCWVG